MTDIAIARDVGPGSTFAEGAELTIRHLGPHLFQILNPKYGNPMTCKWRDCAHLAGGWWAHGILIKEGK